MSLLLTEPRGKVNSGLPSDHHPLFLDLVPPPEEDAAATCLVFLNLQVSATLPHGGHAPLTQLLRLSAPLS